MSAVQQAVQAGASAFRTVHIMETPGRHSIRSLTILISVTAVVAVARE